MKNTTKEIINELNKYRNEEKAAFLPRFFKTGKGQYGEGDNLSGLSFPTFASWQNNISMPIMIPYGNYSHPRYTSIA